MNAFRFMIISTPDGTCVSAWSGPADRLFLSVVFFGGNKWNHVTVPRILIPASFFYLGQHEFLPITAQIDQTV